MSQTKTSKSEVEMDSDLIVWIDIRATGDNVEEIALMASRNLVAVDEGRVIPGELGKHGVAREIRRYLALSGIHLDPSLLPDERPRVGFDSEKTVIRHLGSSFAGILATPGTHLDVASMRNTVRLNRPTIHAKFLDRGYLFNESQAAARSLQATRDEYSFYVMELFPDSHVI